MSPNERHAMLTSNFTAQAWGTRAMPSLERSGPTVSGSRLTLTLDA